MGDDEFASEPHMIEALFREVIRPHAEQTANKLITDCCLVAFAEAANAGVVTFDTGVTRVAHRRRVPVVVPNSD